MVETMQMPRVQACATTECGYNHDGCRAFAITVGGQSHASCDTFIVTNDKGGLDLIASVGACKRADCRYNTELECHAPAIQVGPTRDTADCLTYQAR
jgi:hypothetical protein